MSTVASFNDFWPPSMPCRYFSNPVWLGSPITCCFPHAVHAFSGAAFTPSWWRVGWSFWRGSFGFPPPGTRPNLMESFRSFLLLSPLISWCAVLKCSATIHTWGLARHPGTELGDNVAFLAHFFALAAATKGKQNDAGELVVFIFWLNYLCPVVTILKLDRQQISMASFTYFHNWLWVWLRLQDRHVRDRLEYTWYFVTGCNSSIRVVMILPTGIKQSHLRLIRTCFGYSWPLQQMTNKMNAAKVLLIIITWLPSVLFSLCPVVTILQLDRQQISMAVSLYFHNWVWFRLQDRHVCDRLQ